MFNPYMMPSSLHPHSSSTKLVIGIVVVIAILAIVVVFFGSGKGNSLFKQNVQTHNTVNSNSNNCIGSTTELVSESGIKSLSELNIGDKILTYDSNTGQKRMSTIYWIRIHDRINHYVITTTTDIFTLSSEHLLLLETGEYVKARNLKVNDRLFSLDKDSTITSIDVKEDTAMSPIVLDGKVIMPNSTVISCWSGTTDNANKMDSLMKILASYTDKYSVIQMSDIIEKFYMAFLKNNKDISKVSTILTSLNIPIICK